MKLAAPATKPAMRVHLATLAQSSVQQLREAIRRVTSAHAAAADECDAEEFLAGVDVGDANCTDWEETSFDVRQLHG